MAVVEELEDLSNVTSTELDTGAVMGTTAGLQVVTSHNSSK